MKATLKKRISNIEKLLLETTEAAAEETNPFLKRTQEGIIAYHTGRLDAFREVLNSLGE